MPFIDDIPFDLKYCKFKYKCPENWYAFDDTDNADIKFCRVCEKNVYAVYDYDTFIKHAKAGNCIATFKENFQTEEEKLENFINTCIDLGEPDFEETARICNENEKKFYNALQYYSDCKVNDISDLPQAPSDPYKLQGYLQSDIFCGKNRFLLELLEEDVKLKAIKHNERNLHLFKHQTLNMQLEAIKQDPKLISTIEKPKKEIKELAINLLKKMNN